MKSVLVRSAPAAAEEMAWPGLLIEQMVAPLTKLAGRWRGLGPAAVLALAALALASARLHHGHVPVGLAVAGALVATVPLLAVRRWPLAGLGLVVLANGGYVAAARLSWPLTAVIAWLVATALAPMLLRRGPAVALLIVSELAVVVAVFVPATVNATPWDATLAEALALLVAWGLGESVRARRLSAARAASVAGQLRSLHERDAVARGREGLARELHDVVAHHVSLIAVRAATAPYQVDELSASARLAFGDIAAEARAALEELRTVLGVLRSPDGLAPQAPQPVLADLPALVERVRLSGLDVLLTCSGDERPLAESVQLCCYRIVQEALTNAGRHAARSRVTVQVSYGRHDVAVVITDTGGAAVDDCSRPGGGFGLIGMRERVAALGGDFHAGARGSGFEVKARIPVAIARARLPA
ncbi:MAG: histidine kinase [Jatrophihabitantaceae bacterium]